MKDALMKPVRKWAERPISSKSRNFFSYIISGVPEKDLPKDLTRHLIEKSTKTK